MIACMKDGMSKHAQHTLKDGQINQKLKLTLLEEAQSMISQKVTNSWVTLGTVTIALSSQSLADTIKNLASQTRQSHIQKGG